MPFALLQVIESQLGELVATESTCNQEGKQRPITFALEPLPVWCLPQSLPLFCRQPVAQPDAEFLHTLDAPYSRSQIGTQEAALCRLIRQSPNGAKPEVNCTWREVTGLEVHPITDDHCLTERQPWLGAVPVHEFVNCMAIAALRVRAGKAVENRGLRDFKIW